MSEKDVKKATNLVVLSTVTEVAKATIKNLDGSGIVLQLGETGISDDVLNQMIVSRIAVNLDKKLARG